VAIAGAGHLRGRDGGAGRRNSGGGDCGRRGREGVGVVAGKDTGPGHAVPLPSVEAGPAPLVGGAIKATEEYKALASLVVGHGVETPGGRAIDGKLLPGGAVPEPGVGQGRVVAAFTTGKAANEEDAVEVGVVGGSGGQADAGRWAGRGVLGPG
jgi:hypothetical protein